MSSNMAIPPKSISRVLAVISVICGCHVIIQQFMKSVLPNLQGHFIQAAFFGAIFMLLFGGMYFALAVFLWKHNESNYIPLWAMLPCVILFQPLGRLGGFIVYSLLKLFLVGKEAKIISLSCVLFLGLLSVGIIYICLKRLLFHIYNTKEVIDVKTCKTARYIYLSVLTYTFWAMVVRSCVSIFQQVTHLEMNNPFMLLTALIIGSIVSFGFFRLCRYYLITKSTIFQQSQQE